MRQELRVVIFRMLVWTVNFICVHRGLHLQCGAGRTEAWQWRASVLHTSATHMCGPWSSFVWTVVFICVDRGRHLHEPSLLHLRSPYSCASRPSSCPCRLVLSTLSSPFSPLPLPSQIEVRCCKSRGCWRGPPRADRSWRMRFRGCWPACQGACCPPLD